MDNEDRWGGIAPAVPTVKAERGENWSSFDDSVNALYFGFVATAILISMFIVMAMFEKFLSSRSPPAVPPIPADLEAQMADDFKLRQPSPKMSIYGKWVSVLMPGDEYPTFIANPAPIPCPPEPIFSYRQQHSQSFSPSSTPH